MGINVFIRPAERNARITKIFADAAKRRDLALAVGSVRAQAIANVLEVWAQGLGDAFELNAKLRVARGSAKAADGQKIHIVSLNNGRFLPDTIVAANIGGEIRIGYPDPRSLYGDRFMVTETVSLEDVDADIAMSKMVVLAEQRLVAMGLLRERQPAPGV